MVSINIEATLNNKSLIQNERQCDRRVKSLSFSATDPCPTSFVKTPGRNCGGHVYGNFDDLGEALEACAKDSNCVGVEENNCAE